MRVTRSRVLLAGLTVLLATCGEKKPARESTPRSRPFVKPFTGSVRITVQSLWANNGVPVGWRFTVPPGDPVAGRQVFADFGCGSCHAVKGEEFPRGTTGGVGPDLTGMGSHHPAEYFVESILDPDKVVVEGPGYYEPNGRSIMPAYPDMTVVQLMDVVAYLKSLRDPEMPAVQPAGSAPGGTPAQLPEPPAQRPSAFYVQVYDVKDGQLAEFQEWFKKEGAAAFLAYDGLVSVETYVDTLQAPRPSLVTMWGFKDEAARDRFVDDPKLEELGDRFDSFIGAHEHLSFRSPPIYRAASLSAP